MGEAFGRVPRNSLGESSFPVSDVPEGRELKGIRRRKGKMGVKLV